MYFFDPTMIILIPGILFGLYATFKVKNTFEKYSRVPTRRGITGAQVARAILNSNNLHDVEIEKVNTHGLGDHYDPRTRVIRLTPQVFESTSVAALGVAAHEAGHAVQHNQGYAPLAIRNAFAPVAGLGTNGSYFIFLIGFILGMKPLMDLGILVFCLGLVFYLITLPVEFNASSRAIRILASGGFLAPDETTGAKKVLNAAALTYIAAVVAIILNLLRLIILRDSRD